MGLVAELVEGLVEVGIFAKTQPHLTSYGWQFERSHRNRVLQLLTIAREIRLGFRKNSDWNQTLNQPRVNLVLLAQVMDEPAARACSMSTILWQSH